MRQSRMSGSVRGRGGRLPRSTRPPFRAPNGVDSHNYHCRGSITQPMRSLCTLYVDGHPPPHNTRFQLVVNLGRTGLTPVELQ